MKQEQFGPSVVDLCRGPAGPHSLRVAPRHAVRQPHRAVPGSAGRSFAAPTARAGRGGVSRGGALVEQSRLD